jgi:hypothetical protein
MPAKSTSDRQARLDALMTVADSCPEGRMLLGRHSANYFASRYLDMDLWDCQEKWITGLERTKQGLVLAPCGHGKTEAVAKVLPLRKLCYNRNLRTLICSKSDDLALKDLAAISNELRYNQKLTGDFGPFWSRKAIRWDQHQIYCIRSQKMKDPSFEAVGLLSSVTGGRFDLIILDDIIDVLNSQSAGQRAKIKAYVEGTLIPRLEPWGLIWAIGTRKHPDDVYGSFLKNKAWTCITDKAIIREPAHELIATDEPQLVIDPFGHEYLVNHQINFQSDDRGECLAPDKWTMEGLLLLRAGIGAVAFEREYQNIVSSDETALFKLAWLEQCRDETLSYVIADLTPEQRIDYVAIIQGGDPSLIPDPKKAESHDSDYTVIWTIGLRRDGMTDLLGLYRNRGLSPSKIETTIQAEYNRFAPTFLALETNSFGIIHAHNLIHKFGLRLVKHHTGANKSDLYVGVPSLAVVFENKRIRLPYRTDKDKEITDLIISEFYGLGTEPHDDIVMAAWIAHCGVDRWKIGQRNLKANLSVSSIGSKS